MKKRCFCRGEGPVSCKFREYPKFLGAIFNAIVNLGLPKFQIYRM